MRTASLSRKEKGHSPPPRLMPMFFLSPRHGQLRASKENRIEKVEHIVFFTVATPSRLFFHTMQISCVFIRCRKSESNFNFLIIILSLIFYSLLISKILSLELCKIFMCMNFCLFAYLYSSYSHSAQLFWILYIFMYSDIICHCTKLNWKRIAFNNFAEHRRVDEISLSSTSKRKHIKVSWLLQFQHNLSYVSFTYAVSAGQNRQLNFQ